MTYQRVKTFLQSTTARLAGSYLLIIMVLSIAFSVVLYQTSSRELGRQIPPPHIFSFTDNSGGVPEYRDFFQRRIDRGRSELITRLIFLNLLVLAGGAALSYYLARRTLEPIEASMDAQSRFVADASHELRTPLTAVIATNEVALRKPKLGASDAKELLSSNLEEMTKLQQLTDSLLTLVTPGSNRDNHQKIGLQDIASDALNRVVANAQAKHITVEDSVPKAVQVHGDVQRLTQTVTVLLDNAIKYSSPKSTIYLAGGSDGRQAFISVRDQGEGIAADDLPHIFERFYRVDKSRTKSAINGYGIGLSIAKSIVVDEHDGVLSVKSEPGKGSTFTVELPLTSS